MSDQTDNENRKISYSSVQFGYGLANAAVEAYKSQPDPQPVYISGYRVHHGTVGALLTGIGILGVLFSDDEGIREACGVAIGAGIKLMEDDIDDLPEWFAFKRQEDEQDLNHLDNVYGNANQNIELVSSVPYYNNVN